MSNTLFCQVLIPVKEIPLWSCVKHIWLITTSTDVWTCITMLSDCYMHHDICWWNIIFHVTRIYSLFYKPNKQNSISLTKYYLYSKSTIKQNKVHNLIWEFIFHQSGRNLIKIWIKYRYLKCLIIEKVNLTNLKLKSEKKIKLEVYFILMW